MTDADVRMAVEASSLRGLPPRSLTDLSAGARIVDVPTGDTIHHEGETAAHLELVVTGLVRAYVSSPDGRTMTVRYCRTGALLGVATLYAGDANRPFAVQALSGSKLLRLDPEIVHAVAGRDMRVAQALLTETSERVLSFVAEMSGNAFASVRQRLARHLLDLASERRRGPDLVAPLTQQELADAVGTAREVVVRVLRELRAEGVVETGRHGITIRDPEALFGSTRWNEGS